MGIFLSASADAAPNPSDPFMVVDGALTVCAMSRQAEALFAVAESEVINRHIGELLVAADMDPPVGGGLAAKIAAAVRGVDVGTTLWARPLNTFGVRFSVRVASCGPPSAALLVLAANG